MLGWFTPDYHVHCVQELTVPRLRAWGLGALLLDADSTLKRYRAEVCLPGVAEWLAELRAAAVGLCLVSNGRSVRIQRFAQSLGLPFVAGACKPLPWGCLRAIRKMAFPPAQTAMVGDQLFADVLAGRLAGLRTVLIDPTHPEEEPWFTRLKRGPEARLLRRIEARRKSRG